ncbi:MAG: hypothetical protein P8P74_06565 [Crocinitomicaceae bacterium]|nr:hypothetical protein [Crocinitomicaceae bacterium]
MKKALLFLGLFTASISFAQNNTLPTSGNVGVGTLNPDTKLEVNGNVKIDSCLIVKDSLIVMSDMRIEGGIKMHDNSVAEDNFKVKGHLKLPTFLYLFNDLASSLIRNRFFLCKT